MDQQPIRSPPQIPSIQNYQDYLQTGSTSKKGHRKSTPCILHEHPNPLDTRKNLQHKNVFEMLQIRRSCHQPMSHGKKKSTKSVPSVQKKATYGGASLMKNKKCIICHKDHRTTAMKCPKRKEIIKDKKEEEKLTKTYTSQ